MTDAQKGSIRLECYQGRDRDWRWRVVSRANGKIISQSSEGYRTWADMIHGALITLGADWDDKGNVWRRSPEDGHLETIEVKISGETRMDEITHGPLDECPECGKERCSCSKNS